MSLSSHIPPSEQEAVPLSADALDELLRKTEVTFHKLAQVKSSLVQLPRTELEMVKLFGFLRDFMMTLLQSEREDRVALRGIFGGDCARISRIRAVLEAIRLSETTRSDSRVASCLSACTSVETVLGDLGLGQALRRAQERQKRTLAEALKPKPEADSRPKPEAPAQPKVEAPEPKAAHNDLEYSECGSPCSADASGVEEAIPEPVSPETVCEPDPQLSPELPIEEASLRKAAGDEIQDGNQENEAGLVNSPLARKKVQEDTIETVKQELMKPTKILASVPTDCGMQNTSESICEPSPEPEIVEPSVESLLRQSFKSGRLQGGQDGASTVKQRSTSSVRSASVPSSKREDHPTRLLRRTKEKTSGTLPESRSTSKTRQFDRQKKSSPALGRTRSDLLKAQDAEESRRLWNASSRRPSLSSATKRASSVSSYYKAEDGGVEQLEAEARARSYSSAYSRLPSRHQLLIRELFSHYVGPGGIPAGAGLGLCKFRRVVRDCGLLKEETVEAEPGDEMLLTLAEADLMLARAAGAARAGVAQKLRTVEAFAQALTEVAIRVSPELMGMPDQALDVFCDAVLVPLGEKVLQGVGQDVRAAVVVLAEHEVSDLMRQCQHGLSAVFASYAAGIGAPDPYRRGHWTARDASRFAADAGLAADLSHALIQQLFGACASYEATCGRGEAEKLSFGCFQLALLATTLRIYGKTRRSPRQCLATLLLRISVQLPGHHDIATAAKLAMRGR